MLFVTYAVPQAIVAIRGRHYLPSRPFDLGKSGIIFNALAPILVIFLTIFICFPYTLPVTAQSMNYLPVTVVSCSLFISAFWLFVKKGVYHGPIIE
ncbi:unnamed protein product [Clonostachys rosea f. rosea IK726]|uniref:Uncharacterized protein n=1 Tax=Clonostachys rosea f. rosea IK726 TaxID=1349383 RepID=A0ACA9UAI0_BIOOC|nr:unnamed protein product [Clonostachys rosea f. rosea IK726]